MAKGITKEEYQAIKDYVKKHPELKAPECAKKLGIGTTTLSHVKNSDDYEHFKVKYSRNKYKMLDDGIEDGFELIHKRSNKSLEELIEEFIDDEPIYQQPRKAPKHITFIEKVKAFFRAISR